MITERVDDIPLLIAELEKSELSAYLNKHFPDHGNWRGLDGGKVIVGFLAFLLSCSDHRLHRVEPWAAKRLHTLSHCLDFPNLTEKDFTDDRLGALLDRFSDQETWDAFENDHNKNMLHVYNLNTKKEAIRLDAMIVQSFREEGDNFKKGYSKQHRADLPQLKVMVATLDPLSMPLSSVVVSGNQADDGLYLQVIKKLEEDIAIKEQLFVGDAKIGSFGNRAYLQKQGQNYLMPMSKKQCSAVDLAAYLENQPEELVEILEQPKDLTNPATMKAKAFEKEETMHCENLDITWTERRLVVHSTAYAALLNRNLDKRLDKVKAKLEQLLQAKQGKKKLETKAEIEVIIEQLLKNHKVDAFIDVEVLEHIQRIPVRKYGNRPAGFKEKISFSLQIQIKKEALKKHRKSLGWRVYATNSPMHRLSTKEAIICYRQEYRIEHKFNELLNKFTALVPVFLKKDHRIIALVHLSLLALKFVSTIQYQVRQALKDTGEQVKELYAGNPGRATAKPTTKMILEAFNNISLVIMPLQNQTIVKISELKPIQLKLLQLLKINPTIYSRIDQFFFSELNLGET